MCDSVKFVCVCRKYLDCDVNINRLVMFLFIFKLSWPMMYTQAPYVESCVGIGLGVSLPHDVTAINATIADVCFF